MTTPEALPSNVQAERLILGAIQLDGTRMGEFRDVLTVSDFSIEKHRLLWRRMVELHDGGHHIDRMTVANALNDKHELEAVDGLSYLASLDDGLPDLHNLEAYAAILREKTSRREVIYRAQQAMAAAFDSAQPLDAILERWQSATTDLDPNPRQDFQTPAEIVEANGGLVGHLEAFRASGLGLPYPRLQRCVGGLFPGELAVLAAVTGGGKTAFALNLALGVAQMGEPVAIFSMEMQGAAITNRLAAMVGEWNSAMVRHEMDPMQRDRVSRGYADACDLPIYIRDYQGTTVYGLIAAIKRLRQKVRVSLVVVDYLQLMSADGRSRTEEVSAIARGLKNAAMELKLPILALSQFRRPDHGGETRRPELRDLKESSEIEQAANLVIFLHGERRFDVKPSELLPWDLIVAKQREGAASLTIPYLWRKDCGRFYEVER